MSQYNRYREEENEKKGQETASTEETPCESETQFADNADFIDSNANTEMMVNEQLKQEINQLKDLLLRNQAELENYKKRTSEERIRERKYAMQDFFMDLIDVVDILNKAINVPTQDENVQKFLKGFVLINTRLRQILENYGVKEIDALNKEFDPTYHSAMETVKVEDVKPNIVIEVVITGYMYKDRVLRPSMVKVSE